MKKLQTLSSSLLSFLLPLPNDVDEVIHDKNEREIVTIQLADYAYFFPTQEQKEVATEEEAVCV